MTSHATPPPLPANPLPGHVLTAMKKSLIRAGDLNQPVVTCFVEKVNRCDPLSFHALTATSYPNRYFWSCPKPQLSLVGIGECFRIEAHGINRFNDIQRDWKHLIKNSTTVCVDSQDGISPGAGIGPTLMGGFSFFPSKENGQQKNDPVWDGFSDALMILPELTYTVSEQGAWMNYHIAAPPQGNLDDLKIQFHTIRGIAHDTLEVARSKESSPVADRIVRHLNIHGNDTAEETSNARNEWNKLVEDAVTAIRQGVLEKAVVARDVDATSEKPFSPTITLDVLAENYPDCFLFSYAQKGRTFVGATPERLVALRGKTVEVTCLAGSTARGDNEKDDHRLGQALLNDSKNLFEHNLVINMVRDVLADRLETINIADKPRLLKLKNVQHLFTPVDGTMRPNQSDTNIMTLVDMLHPTPAVGGFPKQRSMDWLREYENFDRGWYAAPVGWIGPEGDGEFVVAIRSALINGHNAKLFAGCGIVSESVKEAEFEESSIKLLPMVRALERSQP